MTQLPSQRERRRYILARFAPEGIAPDPRELYAAVAEACTALWGDVAASEISPSVMAWEGHAILRCRRGTEDRLATALATITRIGEERAAVRTITTSGTLHAIRSRPSPRQEVLREKKVGIGGRVFLAKAYPGQKVDLIEKGIKGKELLFFTDEDGEVR
ncbi:MAG TPA: Rpp14/Pop5 family protein [Methanomicrobiales archaeon]|jgi:ribonuclease P/MRP protein subunit POP5|nr:Rpp14/Pop5 family protein [Methanomicrobiales archaeon]